MSEKLYAYFKDGHQEEITSYYKSHEDHIQFSTASGVYLYKAWTSGANNEKKFAFYKMLITSENGDVVPEFLEAPIAFMSNF
jgi:hypothetical protein